MIIKDIGLRYSQNKENGGVLPTIFFFVVF